MKAIANALLVTKAAASVQAAVPHKAIVAGYLRLFTGRDAAAHENVCEITTRNPADHPEDKGNGGREARELDAHVPLDLEVARQPRGINPRQINAAEIAEDHAPRGSEAEQLLPLPERHLGSLTGRIAVRAIGCLLRGERDFGRIAVEDIPDRRHSKAGDPHDDEHHAPAEAQHQKGEEGHSDRRAQRRGAVEDSGRQAAVARIEPIADDAGAGRKLRRFPYAQKEPGAEKLAETLDESPRSWANDQSVRPQVNSKRGPSLSTMAPVGSCANA